MTNKERRARSRRSRREAEAREQHAAVAQGTTVAQPSVIEEPRQNGDGEHPKRRRNFVLRVVTSSNAWVAIFTGALVATSFIQWHAMLDQLHLSKTTSEQQLRAYIGITNIVLKKADAEPADNSGMLLMPLKNFGSTPASNVHVFYSCLAVEIPPGKQFGRIPDTFSFPDIAPTDERDRPKAAYSYIAPTQEIATNGPVDRKFPVLDPSFTKRFTFYTYGHIDYVDAFGKAHSQLFCFQLAPIAAVEPNSVYQFLRTREHNGEDGEQPTR